MAPFTPWLWGWIITCVVVGWLVFILQLTGIME